MNDKEAKDSCIYKNGCPQVDAKKCSDCQIYQDEPSKDAQALRDCYSCGHYTNMVSGCDPSMPKCEDHNYWIPRTSMSEIETIRIYIEGCPRKSLTDKQERKMALASLARLASALDQGREHSRECKYANCPKRAGQTEYVVSCDASMCDKMRAKLAERKSKYFLELAERLILIFDCQYPQDHIDKAILEIDSSFQAQCDKILEALRGFGKKYPDGQLCFCEMSIGNPMLTEHSTTCLLARAALANLAETDKLRKKVEHASEDFGEKAFMEQYVCNSTPQEAPHV